MRRFGWMIAMVFLLGGCAMESVPFLGKSEKSLALEDVDTQISQQLPMTLKGGFGKIVLGAVVVQGGDQPDRLSVTARFVMTSFEIPEGIDGTVRYNAGLRYDAASHALYFTALEPVSLSFGGDASLQEYISPRARREIPSLAAQGLRSLVVYRFPSSFRANRLGSLTVSHDTLTLEFE